MCASLESRCMCGAWERCPRGLCANRLSMRWSARATALSRAPHTFSYRRKARTRTSAARVPGVQRGQARGGRATPEIVCR